MPQGLRPGASLSLQEGRVANKETRPPPPFTDATLLSAMEGAGASLEDELNEVMREKGLGTPATRAVTIEELVGGGYLARKGKSIASTGVGRELGHRGRRPCSQPAVDG